MSSVTRLKSILSHFCFYGKGGRVAWKSGLESHIGTSQSVLSKNCSQKQNGFCFSENQSVNPIFSLIDRLDNLLDNDSIKITYFRWFFILKVRTSTLKGENFDTERWELWHWKVRTWLTVSHYYVIIGLWGDCAWLQKRQKTRK